jgi:hypothetical protein
MICINLFLILDGAVVNVNTYKITLTSLYSRSLKISAVVLLCFVFSLFVINLGIVIMLSSVEA